METLYENTTLLSKWDVAMQQVSVRQEEALLILMLCGFGFLLCIWLYRKCVFTSQDDCALLLVTVTIVCVLLFFINVRNLIQTTVNPQWLAMQFMSQIRP